MDEAEFAARLRAKVCICCAHALNEHPPDARCAQGLPVPSAAGSESGFSQPAPNTPKSIAAQRAAIAANPFAGSPRGSPRARDAAAWGEPQQPPPAATAAHVPPAAAAAHVPRSALTGEAVVTRWTVEELSAVGEAMLASEAGDGGQAHLARKYRFVNAAAGELKLADVPQLLEEYGALVQRHEALLRGVALMLESSPSGPDRPSHGVLPTSASLETLAAPDLISLH
jgi:hypothetical protein